MRNEHTGDSSNERVISLDHEYQVRYWSTALRAAPEDIRTAIAAVGRSPDAVRRYLQARGQAPEGLKPPPRR